MLRCGGVLTQSSKGSSAKQTNCQPGASSPAAAEKQQALYCVQLSHERQAQKDAISTNCWCCTLSYCTTAAVNPW